MNNKFRAYNRKQNATYNVINIWFSASPHAYVETKRGNELWLDFVLMQCTGVIATKSCRGVTQEDLLIYEGDLLKFNNKIWSVIFANAAFWICNINEKREKLYLDEQDGYEVIGNIHENPELLKDGE